MLAIAADIVTPDAVLRGGALVIDDAGRIADIQPHASALPHAPGLDAAGLLAVPGFIDMHVHGGGGADFMHAAADAARQALRTHARFGTTALLATTITESREAIDAAIAAACLVMDAPRRPDEARLLGIHLEGPYLCPARKGAQPGTHIRPPDPDELRHWIALSGNAVRQITLAPEMPGADDVIRLASEANIIVSLGHTDADAETVQRAVTLGATQATHVFNAMRGLHHREPGMAGAALALPEIVCEVIADGKHLHPLIVRLIVQAKGLNGVVLITDAMEGAAMPDGNYTLGGAAVQVRGGTACFPDGTLAGSVLTMNRAWHNIQQFASLTPPEAARLSSANAARQLGCQSRRGTLEIGKDADIVLLHPVTGDVEYTLIGGEIAYQR